MKENAISYPHMEAVGFLPKRQTKSVSFNKFIISKSIYNINRRQSLHPDVQHGPSQLVQSALHTSSLILCSRPDLPHAPKTLHFPDSWIGPVRTSLQMSESL